MQRGWRYASAYGSGLLTAALVTQAYAQTPSAAAAFPRRAASTVGVEQVVVTAQRRLERLSRVGVTVTAIGAKELVRRGVESPKDLVRLVPGFQATQSLNGNPVYTLRGVGFDTTNAYATSPIGIYVDQAAIPYPYMAQGLLFDLSRVEVLKGPQGTLYGRNATGGLIDYVTQVPTDRFQTGITTEVGNYATVNSTAFISGQIAPGIDMRLTGNTQNRLDGWQKSVTRDETLGEFNQNALRWTTVFDRGGPLTATLTIAYWRKDGDSQAPQAIDYIPGNSPFGSAAARASIIPNPTSDTQADWLSGSRQPEAAIGIFHAPPRTDATFLMTTLKADYVINDQLRVESLSSYDRLNHRDASDFAGVQTEASFVDVTGFTQSLSQELRLIGTYGKLNWSVGGYFANDTSTDRELGYIDQDEVVGTLRYLASLFPQNRYTPKQIAYGFGNYVDAAGSDSNVQAGFANADYKFDDHFKLTLGGRYTHDSEYSSPCTFDYEGGNVPIVNLDYPVLTGHSFNLQPGQCYTLKANNASFVNGPIHESQEQSNFAWRADLDYTPDDQTLIYATISRGFKAGGFPLLPGSSEKQFSPVTQEELTAYEAGSKLGLFDRHVQFDVSGFYYDYLNKQVLGRVADPIFGTLTRIVNIPKSYAYGVEGELTWRVMAPLTFSVSGIYEKTKIQQFMGFDEFSQPTNFAGKPFTYTPEVQVNGGMTYERPLTERLGLSTSVALAYQSSTNGSFADLPLFAVRQHTVVDATLGVTSSDGKWRADLYAKNLFDTYYWSGVTSSSDTVFRYAGLPREYGIRLTYLY